MIMDSKRNIVAFNTFYTIILSIIIALIFGKSLGDVSSWLFVIPKVITVQLISILLFNKYFWKCKIFRKWLVAFPDMSGTWIGLLKSNYINPKTKKRVDPIPCMLVIKHKFKKININFYSGESISYSFSEELNFDSNRHLKRLSYSYTNEPSTLLDYRSTSHKGTTILNLVNDNELIGYYYTDRTTKGEMSFNFHSKEFLDKIPTELPKHPLQTQ